MDPISPAMIGFYILLSIFAIAIGIIALIAEKEKK